MSNHLFFLSLADIFSVYPQIFREIIANENHRRKTEGRLAKDLIYLPSDEEWQERVYYRLLDVQRKINESLESGMTLEEITKKKAKPIFDPSFVIEKFSPSVTPNGGRFDVRKRCAPDHPIQFIDSDRLGCWTLENIAKAARLLSKPPIQVEFDDEHEMRRVYSLIYDVFRYKVVMSNALTDIHFYAHYPTLVNDECRVWLMLFELFTRHFLRRKSEEIGLQNKLYRHAGVLEISQSLWKHRVRLAASISRLRIKNGALELSKLLPSHLQNEKVAIAAANPIVSGWINPFQLSNKLTAEAYLHRLGLREVEQGANQVEQPLQVNQYKWDKICPLFVTILPRDRSLFAQTDVIRNHCLIMQDRTFALAPAIITRLIDHYELIGDIVQTHVASPRSTAYLASLFHSSNRINRFRAYGCGSMIEEYNEYLRALGVENVRLYAESFNSIPLESNKFEKVVGILATPPNSFSAVSDPIDLICSRGGDLNMLQIMTESEISEDGRGRVAEILEEQRETLRRAMSRPQVQFVLYQTHSVVGCENEEMVKEAVMTINHAAFDKHLHLYREKKRLEAQAEAEASVVPAAAMGSSPRKRASGMVSSATTNKSDESQQNQQRLDSQNSFQSDASESYANVIRIPPTDEFEVVKIPDICLNQDRCLDLSSMGCYIALIQRKKMIRLDEKYLIKMAERRGLFGKTDRDKSARTRTSRKKETAEPKKPIPVETSSSKIKKQNQDELVERLSQPTHASLIRSNLRKMSSMESKYMSFNGAKRQCMRYSKIDLEPSISKTETCPRAQRWWICSIKYIQNLQRRSRKRKFNSQERIDITKLMKCAEYPLFLPHRDRSAFNLKEPYPVTVSYLDFNKFKKQFANTFASEICLRPFRGPSLFHTFRPLRRNRTSPRPLGFYSFD